MATLCPVTAYSDWVHAAFLFPKANAPVFRAIHRSGTVSEEALHPGSVTKLLSATLKRCGFDEDEADEYSSHSLRRGLATSWYALGGSHDALTHWVGWADPRTAIGYQDEVRSLPEELQRIHGLAVVLPTPREGLPSDPVQGTSDYRLPLMTQTSSTGELL